jgi:hypothetical protein
MASSRGTKGRGRTSITKVQKVSPSHRWTDQEKRTQATRPVKAGTVKRGDRRDTHPIYTGNNRKAARGRTAPGSNTSTRKD